MKLFKFDVWIIEGIHTLIQQNILIQQQKKCTHSSQIWINLHIRMPDTKYTKFKASSTQLPLSNCHPVQYPCTHRHRLWGSRARPPSNWVFTVHPVQNCRINSQKPPHTNTLDKFAPVHAQLQCILQGFHSPSVAISTYGIYRSCSSLQ